jgi:hypothetical protein
MLLVLTNICCDNCANKVKEYKTLDENNALEIEVCHNVPGYIRFVLSLYHQNVYLYNWAGLCPTIPVTKKRSLCINYTRKVKDAN